LLRTLSRAFIATSQAKSPVQAMEISISMS
jgi:hypothetical protein